MTPDEARTELVRLLELEPMGTRPDGKATWDDVVAYVAKAIGTRTMAVEAVRRRTGALAAAVEMPADTPWRRLVDRVRLLRQHVPGDPTASAPDPGRALCSRCGHTWYRHEAVGHCVQPVEVNRVDGKATGFEQCGCTERRPS